MKLNNRSQKKFKTKAVSPRLFGPLSPPWWYLTLCKVKVNVVKQNYISRYAFNFNAKMLDSYQNRKFVDWFQSSYVCLRNLAIRLKTVPGRFFCKFRFEINYGLSFSYLTGSWVVLHSNLDILNKSVRPFLFTLSNN